MDSEKLIERLKQNTSCWTDTVYGYADLRLEAAAALSALQAELDVMTQRNDENLGMCRIWERRYSELQAENEKLRAELEQVKAERDAAVDCCSGYCASCLFVKDCAKHDMNDAAPTRWYYGDCEDWEWRGWKEG